jgi:hypothetical protein
MQLKIQRSQRTDGVISKAVYFALDVQVDYSHAEQENISKYKLGRQIVYNSKAAQKHFDKADAALDGSVTGGLKGIASGLMARMHLVVTVESLGNGQHIECKDLAELIEAEDSIMDACRNVKGFLQVAATFDGSTTLIDFDKGEAHHRSSGMPDLTRHAPVMAPPPTPMLSAPTQIEGRPTEVATPREAVGSMPLSSMRPGTDSEAGEDESKLFKFVALVVGVVILIVLLVRYA